MLADLQQPPGRSDTSRRTEQGQHTLRRFGSMGLVIENTVPYFALVSIEVQQEIISHDRSFSRNHPDSGGNCGRNGGDCHGKGSPQLRRLVRYPKASKIQLYYCPKVFLRPFLVRATSRPQSCSLSLFEGSSIGITLPSGAGVITKTLTNDPLHFTFVHSFVLLQIPRRFAGLER